jgi:hypothetical protein
MAQIRELVIASMAAPGWLRINEVSNLDMHFTALCGGMVKVTRSKDGKTFRWETNTDHIRLFIKMDGPSDLPFITHLSQGVGWFKLDGFEQIRFGSVRPLNASGGEILDIEELSNLDMSATAGVVKSMAA